MAPPAKSDPPARSPIDAAKAQRPSNSATPAAVEAARATQLPVADKQPASAALSAGGGAPAKKPLPTAAVVAAARARVDASPKPPRRLFKLTSEHGLIAAGLVAAVSSGAFGLYMNLRSDGQPDISGLQYLTVFAQLTQSKRPAVVPDKPDRFGQAAIDPVVTGTIGPSGPAKPGDHRETGAGSASEPAVDKTRMPLKGYVIRDVFDGMALVESRYGLTLVKPDTLLLGAGRVISIERHAGKWAIVTSEGTIAQAN